MILNAVLVSITLVTICFLGCCSNEVHFEVNLGTILATNNVTTVGHVFGLTAYGNGKVEDFTTPAGVEYLKHWNIDFIGFGNGLAAILPQGKDEVLSLADLKQWMYSDEARELFKATATYGVLRSRGIAKAGSQQLLFLRDEGCTPHCASVECYKNLTPKPLNGTNFEWWATLFTGFYRFCAEADPTATLLHIWNEPNTYFYHDHKNGTYFAEFYVAIAKSIKKEFPNAIIGGPVLEDDPIGPIKPNSSYITWEDYSKTLIDAAVPNGLLDYFDFHSYSTEVNSSKTFSQPLLGGLHTVDAYSYVKYGKHLTSAITESNIKIFNDTEEHIRSFHFNQRTFPLIISTMALLKNPDKIMTRMLFDYKTPGKKCNCQFNGYPDSPNTVTPEMEAYYLLGKLRNGTRLFIDTPIVNVPPGCTCLPGQSIQYGNSTVLLEAAYVKGNLTIAIVNMCNCTLRLTARIDGVDQSQVLTSWGAILDVQSLREVDIPLLPDVTMSLPSTSLVTLTYTLKIPYHFTTNTVSFLHYYPKTPEEIMVSMPLSVGCNYQLPVSYDLSNSNHPSAVEALVRFGMLGPAGDYTWNISISCEGTADINVSVHAPGAYAEVSLPCVPDIDHNGITVVKFSVVECDKSSYFSSPAPRAYFEFALLVLRY